MGKMNYYCVARVWFQYYLCGGQGIMYRRTRITHVYGWMPQWSGLDIEPNGIPPFSRKVGLKHRYHDWIIRYAIGFAGSQNKASRVVSLRTLLVRSSSIVAPPCYLYILKGNVLGYVDRNYASRHHRLGAPRSQLRQLQDKPYTSKYSQKGYLIPNAVKPISHPNPDSYSNSNLWATHMKVVRKTIGRKKNLRKMSIILQYVIHMPGILFW